MIDGLTLTITPKDLEKFEYLCYLKVALNKNFLSKTDELTDEDVAVYTKTMQKLEDAIEKMLDKLNIVVMPEEIH